ncbi:MAG: hypothetical protein HQM00_05615 [Magnetococcales bacterium]|nr:hypothetical protein [Magnetococcales bacterium]
MELIIDNFLGVCSAQISIAEGITLVAGDNGAGKSSTLRAAAACATGSLIPVTMPTGKEAVLRGSTKSLVHTGEKKGTVTMEHDGNEISLSWPANSIKGLPPVRTTALSAGLVEWMGIPSAERMKILAVALSKNGTPVDPTMEDLAEAMLGAGIGDEKYFQYVRKLIEAKGWANALQEISTSWSEITGMWRAATGESYGTEKAKDWQPKDWARDMNSMSEANLMAALESSRAALEDGISRRAVDGATVETLRAHAVRPLTDPSADEEVRAGLQKQISAMRADVEADSSTGSELKAKIAEAETNLRSHNGMIRDAESSRPSMPVIPSMPGESNRNSACPSCGTGLYVSSKAGILIVNLESKTTPAALLEAEEAITKAKQVEEKCRETSREIDAKIKRLADDRQFWSDKLTQLNGEFSAWQQKSSRDLHDRLQSLHTRLSEVSARLKSIHDNNKIIKNAQEQLRQIDSSGVGTVSDDAIAALRADVERHAKRLEAFKAKSAADQAARRAERLAMVKVILSQDGLRASKLRSAMDHVSVTIGEICASASWPPLTMDADMNATLDGRPFHLLSKSEQFRVQVVMQVAMARLDGSKLLIIDGADILGPAGRFGLIKMLRAVGIRSLVAMTAKRDYAEMVGKIFDAAYWVDGGKVSLIAGVKE